MRTNNSRFKHSYTLSPHYQLYIDSGQTDMQSKLNAKNVELLVLTCCETLYRILSAMISKDQETRRLRRNSVATRLTCGHSLLTWE